MEYIHFNFHFIVAENVNYISIEKTYKGESSTEIYEYDFSSKAFTENFFHKLSGGLPYETQEYKTKFTVGIQAEQISNSAKKVSINRITGELSW